MKKAVAAAVLALGAGQVQAAPCSSGTLADYVGLGSCEIGSNTVSGFEALGTVPFGATLVASQDILVTPVASSPLGFGFDFGLNVGAAPGLFLDFLVGYRVTGNIYGEASLLVNGVPPVDGVLSAITDLCLNGTFPTGIGSCTSGPVLSLVAAQLPGDPLLTDQKSFSPVNSLAVITDVGIDTGSVGTLRQISVGNRFNIAATAVPAPSVLALLLAGLGGLGLSRRYSRRAARGEDT